MNARLAQALVGVFAAPGYCLVCEWKGCATHEMVMIQTQLGRIRGDRHDGVLTFRGIRYGRAPVGDRRFRRAEPEGGWVGVHDATRFGASSFQQGIVSQAEVMDEDCLFLNICTPAVDGRRRPVLFWIHGGGFTAGSGDSCDGSMLVGQGDVVVVSINYRLGISGFMKLDGFGEEFSASAAAGITDQILALKWVRDNIEDYGGDPGNVTIFGESAGAGAVNAILTVPDADGLYHRAIAHSGGAPAVPPPDNTATLLAELGVPRSRLIEKLQSLTPTELLALQDRIEFGAAGIDGVVVTRTTHEAIAASGSRGVPYIAGTNRDEGTLFSAVLPLEAFIAMAHGSLPEVLPGTDPGPYLDALSREYGDGKAACEQVVNDFVRRPSILNARAATEAGVGGWLYRFDLPCNARRAEFGGRELNVEELGATHACEIPFTFNAYAMPESSGPRLHDPDDPVVPDLARRWSDTIVAFARTGNPNGAGLPEWPRHDAHSKACLVLDRECSIQHDLDALHERLWAG